MADAAIGADTTSFLGIKDTDKESYKAFLQTAAATDFWHDFHHAKSAPILDRLGKSYNVNSGLSVRAYQTKVLDLRSRFQATGATLYDMFKTYETPLMLLGDNPATFNQTSEDNILNSLLPEDKDSQGEYLYKYQNIRGKLLTEARENQPASFNVFDRIIEIGPYNHPYTIAATPVKNRGVFNYIAPTFETISNGTKNYILMIDASFLSISQLRKLAIDNRTIYNFFIIQSIENDGDPATKIGNFEKSDNPNVNVYFLKDTGYKTYYTPFYDGSGNNSNLFSGCSISAYRDSDGSITADIKSNNISRTIENVGTASEPNEAGFLAFQKLITKGLGDIDEAMIYFLMKRAGDWCQALCLLDRGRSYSIETVGNSVALGYTSGSLQQIIDTYGQVEVALLTHDKILLSYALSMGLNAYYTIKVVAAAGAGGAGADENSSSVIWLTYFKNTLDSDPNAIVNAANEKWKSVKKDIQKILDTISEMNPAVTGDTLDEVISGYYNAIASTCIGFIKANKEEASDGFYVDGTISKFILSVRVILDFACKIGEKPEESIILLIQTVDAAANLSPNAYFSLVSSVETKIHMYLQISQFIKQLYSLDAEEIVSYFSDENKKVQELEKILESDSPLKLKNGAQVEPYQYFLLTTIPAIKKDLDEFTKRFGGIAELNDALALDIAKYKGPDIRSQRKKDEWNGKIKTWYESYTKGLGLPGGVQQGGITPYNIRVRIPLQTNKYIKTRGPFIQYNLELFQTSFHEEIQSAYPGLQNIQSYLENTATRLYNEEAAKEIIHEPGLTAYIGEVLEVFFEMIWSSFQLGITKEELNNILTAEWVSDREEQLNEQFGFARVEVRHLYVEDDTTVDVGTTITYNDGKGYTALDDCIITSEEIPYWIQYLTYNHDDRESLDPRTPDWLLFRFILFNLDRYTNKIHEVDTETSTDDEIRYMKKIKTVVDTIYGALSTLGTDESALSLNSLAENAAPTGYINEETFLPSDEPALPSILLTDIAIAKIVLIVLYNQTIMIGSELDEYQRVRLFLLLCPSIESTSAYFTRLLELLPGEVLTLAIAQTFQYIKYNNKMPPSISQDMKTSMEVHINALKDGFYDFVSEAKKQEQIQQAQQAQEEREAYQNQLIELWQQWRQTEQGQQNPLEFEAWKQQLEQNQFEEWLQQQEQQQQGGKRKRFGKTRSKPKIRKQTRRRSKHKKYRNKTKRA